MVQPGESTTFMLLTPLLPLQVSLLWWLTRPARRVQPGESVWVFAQALLLLQGQHNQVGEGGGCMGWQDMQLR